MKTIITNSGILQGTPEEIVNHLWRTCFYRMKSARDYMLWRAMIEEKWSGRRVDTTTFHSFLESLYD